MTGAATTSKNEDDENPFSMYYGMLSHQQNMLQDHVRTSTYQRAMLENASDFKDKVVLDVGTGSGILAYFALQAGARKVYAVELSQMAECAKKIMQDNKLDDRIIVLRGKVEEIEVPEPVDIVISEPMGFFLVHERMLEAYVAGRIKWMKPSGGLMFPSVGTMYFSPFTDDSIYQEQMSKVAFWQNRDFYGLDVSSMSSGAMANHFSQPVVGYFPESMLISESPPVSHKLDFGTISPEDLYEFDIPFEFVIKTVALMHGMGCWFTVDFNGSSSRVTLSTGPEAPGTHWYQCRLLLQTPVAVNVGQVIRGNMKFQVNKKFSYDIDLKVTLDGCEGVVSENHIKLHDQMYHYMYNSNSSTTS